MSKNLFNSISVVKPKRNYFDLSHDFKYSSNMGTLVPVFWDVTVPGDTYNISCENVIRFAPMIAPIYHQIYQTVHYFAVPLRILWENYPTWTADDTSSGPLPVAPYIELDSVVVNATSYRLLDYLGLPLATDLGSRTGVKVSAFPLAAYFKIWADYYRAEFFQTDPEVWKLDDGLNIDSNLLNLERRCWEHDYFTACLPFAQAGEQVSIPISSIEKDVRVYTNDAGTGPNTWSGSGATTSAPLRPSTNVTIPDAQLYANTDGLPIGAGSINDFRTALRVQQWKEKNARAGTRINEIDFMHFGVRSQDARLQRAEYICGVKGGVVISEVLNTTGAVDGLPQGNMAGHGVGVVSSKVGSFFSNERCIIMGIASTMPKTAYQQGIDRRWQYFDPMNDQYWPVFANLGEQEVLNQEVYAKHSDPEGTFGYIPRFAHLKQQSNRVAGDFRTSLNYWHMARIFGSEPSLNASFLQCDPTNRIFAVTDTDTDHLYCYHLNKIGARRPMPKYGTPL